MKIHLRPSKPTDLSFVYDSWLNSWRRSPWAGTIPNHLYYETQRETISGLLRRGAQVTILCAEGLEDFIIGWACHERTSIEPVLHYLYIKDPYLSFGFHHSLLDSLNGPGFYTHRLPLKALRKWKHVPEIARRQHLNASRSL
jgi:hypothetical protein